MADPWIISPAERSKHDEQFRSLGASGGYITGEQAKGFFLQSRLAPPILGVIWMLSDIDEDGKMNPNEFSIACKLINMKLRGFNLPQVLPPALKQSAMRVPVGMPAAIPPMMPSAPLIGGTPPVAPVVPMAPSIPQVAPVAPIMQPAMPVQQTQIPAAVVPGIPPVGAPIMSGVISPPLGGSVTAPMVAPTPQPSAPVGVAQAPAPVATQPLTSAPKVPIQDTGIEWGVPQASKLKFTQVFNMSDRTKSGFLSGTQSRNILIQSALPQGALAQIWNLSDVDSDGRLSCEEFVLAMYLCESAKAGKPIPTVLPPDLIPPTYRRSRASSIQSQGSMGTPQDAAALSPTSAQLITDTSFEDKRRENYEKGQAELERRRKALLDAQRRETEERLRREREEEMRREKARLEAEKKRQDELEREMQIQREIEAQKDAERKRMEETKEQARKEAERQRQEEWEKQRLLELMNVRQRQQENLLALKAKNQTMTIDLSTKDDKIKELTQKISETRVGVTEVKATIDNMRNTRDTHMSDMNALKAQARDQNQRLLNLNQERARLKARSLASAGASGAETAAVEASVTSKQMVIKQLQEKVRELEEELNGKEEDANNNITEFQSSKEQFQLTGERCKELYEEYCAKRKEVLALREKLLNPDAAWGDVPGAGPSPWSAEPEKITASTDLVEGEERRYRALYQFDARNEDELTFSPGDIILVVPAEGAEPGWLSGSLHGKIGWFPEAYCEPFVGEAPETDAVQAIVNEQVAEVSAPVASVTPKMTGEGVALRNWSSTRGNQLPLYKGDKVKLRERMEGWVYTEKNGAGGWVPQIYLKESGSPVTSPQGTLDVPPIPQYLDHDSVSQYYVSVYPYQSDEPGDLHFEVGETILVIKKEGDWWFGIVGDRTGIFPSNYVEMAPNQLTSVEKEPVPEVEAAPVETILPVQSKAAENEPSSNEEQELEGKGKKQEVAQVIAPYDATSANQLSLVRGQLVSIRKKTASGWWEGELHAKGKKRQLGWFPASYVKVLCGSSRTTPVSMEMTGRDDYPGNITPGSLENAFSKLEKMQAKPNPPPPQDPETVEAIYPYTAINDDELTFEPGDLIFVLDKEDSAWWKGSLRGVIGVFPSNYVQPKADAKIVKPTPVIGGSAVVTSPDADDSLCYTEEGESGAFERRSNGAVRRDKNKRFTTYECFNSPDEKMRQNVIREIISTESSYLQDLILVQRAFIEPMKKSGVITIRDIDLIFINWDELVMVSSSFDKALKVRWKNTGGGSIHMISDILCQQISLLRPYMRFCSLQSKGSVLLNKKFSEGGPWAEFIRQCQERPDVSGHTLTSFLLKPLQRLTKYPLLIKNLLSYTPPEHPDHQNTVDALHAATTLCEQVNEAAHQQDNTDKLEWMQRHIQCDNLMERLVFNSLTNTLGPRKLLYTGLLHKMKSKREIVAFLLSDFLLLTTSSKHIGNQSSLLNFERALADATCSMYRKPLFLSEMNVRPEHDSETAFTIISSGVEVSVAAQSANDRANWLKHIALAQKHIKDTERSQLQRTQSKEKDSRIMGRLLLSVMGGVNLVLSDEVGTLHSFCEVSLGSQVHQTKVATSIHPRWDTAMQLFVKSLSEDVLCITVYEKGFFRPNEFLGRTEVRIQNIFDTCGDKPDPQVMRLALQEVSKGEVILKSSLQLFK